MMKSLKYQINILFLQVGVLKAPLALQLVGARTSREVEEVRKMHTPELFALSVMMPTLF